MAHSVIGKTNLQLPGVKHIYNGKVRDVYTLESGKLVMVATDRISAFDHILPRPIPYKGAVLNQIAAKFLAATQDIVPNWVESTPDPRVSIGKYCEPYKVEMVVRGYLAGHAAREYALGKRILCGVAMVDGLKENDKFPAPIITPTTKASVGHDEDISKSEIIAQGLVSAPEYAELERITLALYARGCEMAAKQGLILVDTKYEFGKIGDTIYLMDEVHTPDSSRYFYAEGYSERQANNQKQKQLSKEFVREWLIENGFQGKDGQVIPEMDDAFVQLVSDRYIELYEHITGEKFNKVQSSESDIESKIIASIS